MAVAAVLVALLLSMLHPGRAAAFDSYYCERLVASGYTCNDGTEYKYWWNWTGYYGGGTLEYSCAVLESAGINRKEPSGGYCGYDTNFHTSNWGGSENRTWSAYIFQIAFNGASHTIYGHAWGS